MRDTSKVDQWKDTGEFISWLKDITNKDSRKFIMFDSKDFYSSMII